MAGWVKRWADAYNYPHDQQLAPLRGKPELDAADRELLARWKFGSYRPRLARILSLLAGNDQGWADELTRRALACDDDLGAWLIAQRIGGVGPALASTMLMAHDPEQFTVIDERAFRSIQVLARTGSLSDGGVASGRLAQGARLTQARTWLAYLRACRVLAVTTGQSLRDVDRALYQANGQAALPPSR